VSIYSLQIEKHVLGGLIKDPGVFADVATFVNEYDFYHEVHSTIYCVLRDSLSKAEKIDKVILAQKIKNLGISFKDDLDIFQYIEALCFTQITPEATIEACKELVKTRIRREISETAIKISNNQKTNASQSIDSIITNADAIYNEKISSYNLNDRPINLFEDIDQFVEERGNNPVTDVGFETPYSEFNRLFGGLRKKNVYAVVSRAGAGKSTILMDMSLKIAIASNFKIRVLLLDTEMETEDLKWRAVSSMTGVPMWYLETGNWRRNEEMVNKVRSALATLKNYKYDHFKVGNKTTQQVSSIAKRWYYSQVGRGEPVVIVYDYIKLTGERISDAWKEHQVIGEKANIFKELADELDCPFLTAMQMNRLGEASRAGESVDDSSAIALSDRLLWFSSFLAIFRRKTVEEIGDDGLKFGTHKLIPLKTRFQGKSASGHQDLVKRRMSDGEEKYVRNYLSFSVKNFHVEEKGSLFDIAAQQEQKFDLDKEETVQSDGSLE
jgi:replicative DNA helicase